MQTNYPSIKTLMRIDNNRTSLEAATQARAILTARTQGELESMPAYDVYYQRIGRHMYNPHSMRELKLHLLNIVLNGYGVEYIRENGDYMCHGGIDYINFGDPYVTTILFYDGRFSVGDWGSIVERNPSKFE
jgi:hypothetical protein